MGCTVPCAWLWFCCLKTPLYRPGIARQDIVHCRGPFFESTVQYGAFAFSEITGNSKKSLSSKQEKPSCRTETQLGRNVATNCGLRFWRRGERLNKSRRVKRATFSSGLFAADLVCARERAIVDLTIVTKTVACHLEQRSSRRCRFGLKQTHYSTDKHWPSPID